MFFSVKGDLPVGDQVVHAELNINATNEAGELLTLGVERASREGVVRVLLATESKSHVAQLSLVAGPDGRLVPELDAEGMPRILDPRPIPAAWDKRMVCKFRVNTDGGKGLRLSGVKISYDDATTKSGHACAKIVIEGYEVVELPRTVATGPVVSFGKVGVSAAYAKRAPDATAG